jgi:hypothetical protein
MDLHEINSLSIEEKTKTQIDDKVWMKRLGWKKG